MLGPRLFNTDGTLQPRLTGYWIPTDAVTHGTEQEDAIDLGAYEVRSALSWMGYPSLAPTCSDAYSGYMTKS